MEAKILVVDDDSDICEDAKNYFQGEVISGKSIVVETTTDFSKAIDLMKKLSFDLIVLDLKGDSVSSEGLELGEQVLNEIRKTCFIPVIFHTCFPGSVQSHESHVIKIVSKGETFEALKEQIANILSSKITDIRYKLENYIKDSMRDYMWKFVHDKWSNLSGIVDERMLNHLLARRLAHMLTQEKIVDLIGEEDYNADIAHPIEIYIYPAISAEYRAGDLLKKDNKFYLLVTPSCDMVLKKGIRKAEGVTLIECVPLSESKEFKEFSEAKNSGDTGKINEKKGKLKLFIENRSGERYFFLPGTHFIADSFVDFQKISAGEYNSLQSFEKIAELDTAYADSLIAKFVRYYNRIGTRDLNSDLIIDKIERSIAG